MKRITSCTHWDPHILALTRLQEELVALTLLHVEPIARLAVADKCALHVLRREIFDMESALRRAKVPGTMILTISREVLEPYHLLEMQ